MLYSSGVQSNDVLLVIICIKLQLHLFYSHGQFSQVHRCEIVNFAADILEDYVACDFVQSDSNVHYIFQLET